MIPSRLPPLLPCAVPASSATGAAPAPASHPADHPVPNDAWAPPSPAQTGPFPPPGAVPGQAPVSGRKRRLPPPPAPLPLRPRTDAAPVPAELAIFPRTYAGLQHQAQLAQAINTARRHFYMERQCGHACAQHAVNAMMGGPLVSLTHFAEWETQVQAQQGIIPAPLTYLTATMLAQGVYLETVHGTLTSLGIALHRYDHRPVVDAQGRLVRDRAQARFLDSLETDRLLLQSDRYEGGGAVSHYVAFRKEGGQWVLLDSLHDAPQYGITPSDYLLRDEGIQHFTALWPQHALRGGVPLSERTHFLLRQGNRSAARADAPQGQPVKALSEVQRKFLAALVPYAAGKTLMECEGESGLAGFHNYLSDAGELKKQGQAVYAKLPLEQKDEVDDACLSRTVWFAKKKIDRDRFHHATKRFSTSSMSIDAIEQAAGLKKGHLGLLLCDSGLTQAGNKYVEEMFDAQEQLAIRHNIHSAPACAGLFADCVATL